ncbi:iron-sulfur cluster-binding protein [Clostridia bacterium]|nr:iron-sulfur cluster-binding protein [Clostridia bacterium]
MNELSTKIKSELTRLGADLVGFGDLRELPPDVREGLPVGISVAVKYPVKVISGISELPTQEYCDWYHKLNEKLDAIVTEGAKLLQSQGFTAIAQTRAYVGFGETEYNTLLPHKTIATRAGLGWIGKSALFVTAEYGSMIRLSSILTDAPLDCAEPVNESKCGECTVCRNACPAEAISGKLWNVRLYRDEFFDPVKCRKTARERAKQGFGDEITICGKCIAVCPRTLRALGGEGANHAI